MPVQTMRVNQPVSVPVWPCASVPVMWKAAHAMMWYCAFAPWPVSVS